MKVCTDNTYNMTIKNVTIMILIVMMVMMIKMIKGVS